MSMTELERVTNQRDYNRRLADHQQTVIDRLNAEITAMQDDAREKRVALIAAEEMAKASSDLCDRYHEVATGPDDISRSDSDADYVHALRKIAAFRAATGAS